MNRIGDTGSREDWHREWVQTADRLFAIGRTCEDAGHKVSAREAYFRASTYYQVSYFPLFGSPVDPWLVDAFGKETESFLCAAKLNPSPIEPVDIPFEGASLPAYFLKPDTHATRRPTILHINGYDGNINEMYFAHGPAAMSRNYNCLLLDGPGQGRCLIRDGLPMRPDWETVVQTAIDYLISCPDVDPDRIVLAGWSFGGYLAPRAAAFEKRIAALIADPGLWDLKPDLKPYGLSDEAIRRFPEIDRSVFSRWEEKLRSPEADPMMHWKIVQRGLWVHGVESLFDLICELGRYELSPYVSQIECPTLLTAAEGDSLGVQADTLFAALRCPKTLIRFSEAEGANGHCEALGRRLYHQRVFDWLDKTLGLI
ncbi:alpha/beta hydrolase family protein [Terriglobus roseus]|nr:alpha/beta fold hydrolase [Terriglobus roseus]